MIICICHRVSDRHIANEVAAGCASFDELQDLTRVATACGVCTGCARDTFTALQRAQLPAMPCFAMAHRSSGQVQAAASA